MAIKQKFCSSESICSYLLLIVLLKQVFFEFDFKLPGCKFLNFMGDIVPYFGYLLLHTSL